MCSISLSYMLLLLRKKARTWRTVVYLLALLFNHSTMIKQPFYFYCIWSNYQQTKVFKKQWCHTCIQHVRVVTPWHKNQLVITFKFFITHINLSKDYFNYSRILTRLISQYMITIVCKSANDPFILVI